MEIIYALELQLLSFKRTFLVQFFLGDLNDDENQEIKLTSIEAWYTLQIPIQHGPAEYWGLPGLILEVNSGNTTMLCSKVVINPSDIVSIKSQIKEKK